MALRNARMVLFSIGLVGLFLGGGLLIGGVSSGNAGLRTMGIAYVLAALALLGLRGVLGYVRASRG